MRLPHLEILDVRIAGTLSLPNICSLASITATTVRIACGLVIWTYTPQEIVYLHAGVR